MMRIAALCISSYLSILPASAGVILSPTPIANDAGESFAGDLAHAFDQSGLTPSFQSGVTDFETYIATGPEHTATYSGYEWFSSPGRTSGAIILDLGGMYNVLGAALWNEEVSGLNSITYSSCTNATCSATTLLGIQRPANNPLFASYDAEVVDLTDAMTRYIRIDMTGPQANAQYNGLAIGELAFNVESTAVPEPSTFVLVTCALAGVALRRLSR